MMMKHFFTVEKNPAGQKGLNQGSRVLEVLGLILKAVGSLTPFVYASGIIWLLVLCLKVLESAATEGDLHLQIPVQDHGKMSENSPYSSWLLNPLLDC